MIITTKLHFDNFNDAFAAWGRSATFGGAYHPTALVAMNPTSYHDALTMRGDAWSGAYKAALAACGDCGDCAKRDYCYNPPQQMPSGDTLIWESCSGTKTELFPNCTIGFSAEVSEDDSYYDVRSIDSMLSHKLDRLPDGFRTPCQVDFRGISYSLPAEYGALLLAFQNFVDSKQKQAKPVLEFVDRSENDETAVEA